MGMLKLYFRELPEPLCTFKQYNTFCDSQKEKDVETSKSKLEAAVASLPPVNKSLLGSVIRMLKVLSPTLWLLVVAKARHCRSELREYLGSNSTLSSEQNDCRQFRHCVGTHVIETRTGEFLGR